MPPPIRPTKQMHGGDESVTPPSNNLFVGNLAGDVTDADLMALFGKHGALDSITSYSSRSYAFVYFKRVEDAKAAKDALQGTVLRGNALKIEFAKPAKPSKSLWVGGISSSVSKEELEEEFFKFGKIEDFKFLRDHNTAFVDYLRLEDASQALKSMNGKRIGGEQIRVDFLRSQPSRREQWPDFRDAREGQFPRTIGPPDAPWVPQDFMRNYSERLLNSQSSVVRKVDGPPSNVLWICYPPSVHVDEQMLHNAMILFGEIERIKSFPSRHYSFVEFRSVDEARLAKEGLQGKLFNDPRISIAFSSSELAPGKDYSGFYPAIKGPRPEIFFNELTYRPAQMEVFSHNRPLVPNSFPGPLPPRALLGPDVLMRPLGPQRSFDPVIGGPELGELAAFHKLQETNPNNLMGGPNWRRSSPAPGMLSSPSTGTKPPVRSTPGGWDVFDANQLERDSKRSRIDSALPGYDASFPLKKVDDRGLGFDQLYGLAPQGDGGAPGPLAIVQGKNRLNSLDPRIRTGGTGGTGQTHPDHDYIWRGIIAKGGTPVCRARCVPIGEGIGSEIPEVVNCSARTGLEMLTKHYADAVGFNIVFFLPDSEEDFASYTEFLRYLGAKDRAGVAKFDDGTTLFLVPPSDFLTKVLNVAGPERLYGVVLKFPHHAPSSISVQPQPLQPQYVDRRQIRSSQADYGMMPRDEKVLHTDYSRVLHEDSKPPPPKLLSPSTSNSLPLHSASINPAAVSQAGVSLTPELIATLASLLPANGKSSASEGVQPPVASSTLRPLTAAAPDKGPPQGWEHESQAPEQTGHPVQLAGGQFNPLMHLPQVQAYPTVSYTPSHSVHGVIGSSHGQDPTFNLQQPGAVSSRPSTNFAIPSQGGQFAATTQVERQYQFESPQDTQKGYGIAHGTDASGLYGSSVPQQPANPVTFPNQIHSANISQPHGGMSLAAENVKSELPNQVQQLPSVLYGAGQGTSEVDVDKNERYRSTLQFAANLLLQIQQQQQQPGAHSGQGSGNH